MADLLEYARETGAAHLERLPDDRSLVRRCLADLLTRGLGDRIRLLRVVPDPLPVWPLMQSWEEAAASAASRTLVALYLDAAHWQRLVDHGPPAEQADAAAAFRKLWGSKAELRRFRDGSVAEAVVWACPRSERDRIVGRIAEHLLMRHLHMRSDEVVLLCDATLCGVLRPADLAARPEAPFGAGDPGPELCQRAVQVVDEFGRMLQQLTELPLAVVSIECANSVARYTAVFPPVARTDRFAPVRGHGWPWLPYLEMIVELERSSRWPPSRPAIAQLKAALYVRMGELLRSKHHLAVAVARTFLDVLMNGLVLRVVLREPHELAVLRADPEASGQLAMLERSLVQRPRHAVAMRTLCAHYPSLGVAARLAKRWLSAHLFSGHLCDEAVELIVAHAYTAPTARRPPVSAVSAFRAFLDTLATHDWALAPLVVRLGIQPEPEHLAAAQDGIRVPAGGFPPAAQRAHLPPVCLVTEHDRTGACWTRTGPSATVLHRLAAFARASLAGLDRMLRGDCAVDEADVRVRRRAAPRGEARLALCRACHGFADSGRRGPRGPRGRQRLFLTPLDDYDAIIELNGGRLPRRAEAIAGGTGAQGDADEAMLFKNLTAPGTAAAVPFAGFDPVERYAQELQARSRGRRAKRRPIRS